MGSASLLAQAVADKPTAESPRIHWDAQWISHPTAPLKEPITLHFKKAIELAAVPEHYVVHVSGDNRFVFYVNGQRVGDGPARGDLAHWRYETFDIAPMLKVGANTLAANVWNFGVYAPVAQVTERTAFLVEGDTKAESAANTNNSWLVEDEPGQGVLPRKFNGMWLYYASGPGEVMHASTYDWTWLGPVTAVEPQGSRWVHAGPALRENVFPNSGIAAPRGEQADVPWMLVPDTLPPMAYTPEDAGHVVRSDLANANQFPDKPLTVAAHTHAHLLLDRSELTTGYPELKFSGGSGAKMTLVYAEALYDAKHHKGNRNEVGTRTAIGITDEVYPDGGKERLFEPMWWRTWRYLDIEVQTTDEPLTLDGLQARYSAYPFKTLASFKSSDPDLDKIFAIGWHTAQLDAHETYMDTPYYEQLQYGGDTRIQAMITYAMTGDDRLPRQAIHALDDSRIPDGITQSRYPSLLPQYIPTFSLLWIGMLHDHWEYHGDKEIVKAILPGTRTVLDWFGGYQHEDGLLSKLPWWSFIDWVETKKEFPSYDKNGESCLTTLQYIGALEDAIDLEKAAGGAAYVDMDAAHLASARRGVMTECWDARFGLVADSPTKDIFSQQANMLAVLHDVVPKKDQQALMHKIIGKELGEPAISGQPELLQASYYFRYYLSRALDHAGMADDYLKTLGSWHEFLKMGFSTWPETSGETRSDSHAWSAHPTFDLLTLVAGISPGSVGFKTVRVAPHLGSLTSLEASYPHPLGLIQVKYGVSGGVTTATVDLPQSLSGVFVWKGKETRLHGGANSLTLK